MTSAEALLWLHLQRSQLQGTKFRRQHSVGPFVLDFYCPSEELAIELDGAAHDFDAAQRRDRSRDSFLARYGIRILRFENRNVRENLEGLLVEISKHFQAC